MQKKLSPAGCAQELEIVSIPWAQASNALACKPGALREGLKQVADFLVGVDDGEGIKVGTVGALGDFRDPV